MSIVKTWYTPEEAEAKFGVSKNEIEAWVDEGLVRTERDGNALLVNGDDIELKLEEKVGILS